MPWRALVAVLALYALALQGLLGGLALAAAVGPDHVLCLAGSETPGHAPHDKNLPAHGHMACCAAAHPAVPAALPAPAPATIPRQAGPVVALARRPEIAAAPRAPPGVSPGARAPPVA